jgi:hypothetical protein
VPGLFASARSGKVGFPVSLLELRTALSLVHVLLMKVACRTTIHHTHTTNIVSVTLTVRSRTQLNPRLTLG